jgi:dinuclear metal center YbgI/SA1388 family protein
MTTVNDILTFLDTLAPSYMKEDWDRVGLNCGHADKEVRRILVALDPFEHVCREAKQVGADLLVTHHALIWTPDFVNDLSQQGCNTLFLIENNIACINAHTNLDCAPGGVNDILAAKLGLRDIRVIQPRGTDEQGREWGLLRQGTTAKQSMQQFLSIVKTALSCEGLRYCDCGKPVHRVAVGGGACASEMEQAAQAGCDTFVTADVKYNQFWDAKNLGLNLIDAGHFHTENPVCRYLTQKLREAFPEITVTMSTQHSDCAKFFR